MRATTTTTTTSTVTRAKEARKKNYLRQWKFISFAERLTSWPKARSFRRDPRFTPDFSPIFNHVHLTLWEISCFSYYYYYCCSFARRLGRRFYIYISDRRSWHFMFAFQLVCLLFSSFFSNVFFSSVFASASATTINVLATTNNKFCYPRDFIIIFLLHPRPAKFDLKNETLKWKIFNLMWKSLEHHQIFFPLFTFWNW